MRIVPPEIGGYLATTFSPDGEMVYYVASSERNNFVPTLYRIPVLGGTPTKVLDRVFGATAFSPDGKTLACGGPDNKDKSVKLWRAATDEEVARQRIK